MHDAVHPQQHKQQAQAERTPAHDLSAEFRQMRVRPDASPAARTMATMTAALDGRMAAAKALQQRRAAHITPPLTAARGQRAETADDDVVVVGSGCDLSR